MAGRYRVETRAAGRRIARDRNYVRDDVAGSAVLRKLEQGVVVGMQRSLGSLPSLAAFAERLLTSMRTDGGGTS